MIEFRDQDVDGVCSEHGTVSHSTFNDAHLNGASLCEVELTGTQIRDALFHRIR